MSTTFPTIPRSLMTGIPASTESSAPTSIVIKLVCSVMSFATTRPTTRRAPEESSKLRSARSWAFSALASRRRATSAESSAVSARSRSFSASDWRNRAERANRPSTGAVTTRLAARAARSAGPFRPTKIPIPIRRRAPKMT